MAAPLEKRKEFLPDLGRRKHQISIDADRLIAKNGEYELHLADRGERFAPI